MKWLLALGSLSGFLSVAAGAFGSHALKQKLAPDMLAVFEVGARYQMYHALAMCLVALLGLTIESSLIAWSGWLFFAGTAIFSGSLYLLALTGARFLGAITPIGGVLLLIGWLLLACAALRH